MRLTYRLTVRTSFGSLYRSFSTKEPALFMAAQAKSIGYGARVEVIETVDGSLEPTTLVRPRRAKRGA